MTPSRANEPGGSGPFPVRVNLATRPGKAIAGKPAPPRRGLPALTILRPISSTGEPAIPDPIGTATSAKATTSTPIACSRSMPTPANASGIFSSRLTMFTTGTRPRFRCLSTDRFAGKQRKLVLFPNRNAFYYVLDRLTGEFLVGKPYVKQTWAKGLDDSGRPIRAPNTMPSLDGTRVWPSVAGGNNWYSPTYNPKTNLFYVAVREAGSVYFIGDPEYKEGEQFNGGGFRSVPSEQEWGAVTAFDPGYR